MSAHVYKYIRKHFSSNVAETHADYICMHLYIFIFVYMYLYICKYKQTHAYTTGILRVSIKHLKWKQSSYILNTCRGIGTETCWMDYVFPPDDLWFGSGNKNCTCMVLYIYIYIYICVCLCVCVCVCVFLFVWLVVSA